jgi:hypothetical protein
MWERQDKGAFHQKALPPCLCEDSFAGEESPSCRRMTADSSREISPLRNDNCVRIAVHRYQSFSHSVKHLF